MGKTNGLNVEPAMRVLDSVLLDPSLWRKAESLSPDDFFNDIHKTVFAAMRKLASEGKDIALPNLLDIIPKEDLLLFDADQAKLYPRTRPNDIDCYIEKTKRETAIRNALREISKLATAGVNGGITENDLKRIGEMGRAIRSTRRLIVHDLNDFLVDTFPVTETLIRLAATDIPVFTSSSINQIFAWRGTGKTMLSMALAGCFALGTAFLRWRATRKVKVLYVEGESRNSQLQQRARAIVGKTDAGYFRLLTFASQVNGILPLSTAQGRQALEAEIGDAEVLFLDSISTLGWFATNDEENWLEFLQWLNHLRQLGLCVIFLHHAGKSGMSRGHSRSEDMLDISIKLTRDEADKEVDWLKFTMEYDKFRDNPKGIRSTIVQYREGRWTDEFVEVEKLRALDDYLVQHPTASSRKIAHDLPELGTYRTVQNLRKKLDAQKT
jgi:AAA domain/DnaB-like helicase N terminal domain